jgi:glycosyltransferase involved in cell wall biosynthesis
MRIAQVVASYHPLIGGVEKHVQRLASGCAEEGDQVTILTHQPDNSPSEERTGAIRVLRFPLSISARNYQVSAGLFRYMKSHAADFDLVHAHSYHTVMGHTAMSSNLPFVYTPHYHGTGHTSLRAVLHQLYRPLGRRQLQAADAIICNSDAERQLILKDFPSTSGKLATILPGTDVAQAITPGNRFQLTGPVLLTAGRLERYKNIDLIVHAFGRLPFSASLVIVGEGPDRGRLERHARVTRSDHQIVFTGKIAEQALHQLFAQASLVVSASDHEAFGLTIAEGLASGAQVLASPIPAHIEIAERAGVSAPIVLVDPRDDMFVEQMARLLLAERVTTTHLELPTWADFVKEVRALYAQVSVLGRL